MKRLSILLLAVVFTACSLQAPRRAPRTSSTTDAAKNVQGTALGSNQNLSGVPTPEWLYDQEAAPVSTAAQEAYYAVGYTTPETGTVVASALDPQVNASAQVSAEPVAGEIAQEYIEEYPNSNQNISGVPTPEWLYDQEAAPVSAAAHESYPATFDYTTAETGAVVASALDPQVNASAQVSAGPISVSASTDSSSVDVSAMFDGVEITNEMFQGFLADLTDGTTPLQALSALAILNSKSYPAAAANFSLLFQSLNSNQQTEVLSDVDNQGNFTDTDSFSDVMSDIPTVWGFYNALNDDQKNQVTSALTAIKQSLSSDVLTQVRNAFTNLTSGTVQLSGSAQATTSAPAVQARVTVQGLEDGTDPDDSDDDTPSGDSNNVDAPAVQPSAPSSSSTAPSSSSVAASNPVTVPSSVAVEEDAVPANDDTVESKDDTDSDVSEGSDAENVDPNDLGSVSAAYFKIIADLESARENLSALRAQAQTYLNQMQVLIDSSENL